MRARACAIALFCALAAPLGLQMLTAQDARRNVDVEVRPGGVKVEVEAGRQNHSKPWRASKLIGMAVKNAANEDLGKIEDLVIDAERGQVRYAALSFGGFLEFGEKLFAVPWQTIRIQHKGNEAYAVLNIDPERLKRAPGFDKEKWPDFGNPRFSRQIDEYYGSERGAGSP